MRTADARMSGEACGAIGVHISPESADGGPLALVQNGDRIRLDVEERRLDLLVDEAELARRRVAWVAPEHPGQSRGYLKLYMDEVTQAEEGADFRFLTPAKNGQKTP